MNLRLLSVLYYSLFATKFGGPCWPSDRIQVFVTSVMASFLKQDAPSISLYSKWCDLAAGLASTHIHFGHFVGSSVEVVEQNVLWCALRAPRNWRFSAETNIGSNIRFSVVVEITQFSLVPRSLSLCQPIGWRHSFFLPPLLPAPQSPLPLAAVWEPG